MAVAFDDVEDCEKTIDNVPRGKEVLDRDDVDDLRDSCTSRVRGTLLNRDHGFQG